MIEKLGGRKFILTVLILLGMFVLVIAKAIDPEAFLKFAALVTGTYELSNVASKIADK